MAGIDSPLSLMSLATHIGDDCLHTETRHAIGMRHVFVGQRDRHTELALIVGRQVAFIHVTPQRVPPPALEIHRCIFHRVVNLRSLHGHTCKHHRGAFHIQHVAEVADLISTESHLESGSLILLHPHVNCRQGFFSLFNLQMKSPHLAILRQGDVESCCTVFVSGQLLRCQLFPLGITHHQFQFIPFHHFCIVAILFVEEYGTLHRLSRTIDTAVSHHTAI